MLTIRLLDPAIDGRGRRARFRCGNRELERWFETRSVANQGTYGVTYVAVDGDEIVGIVAVAASSIRNGDAGSREGPATWPVLLLGRMGVHTEHQRRGIGERLVLRVFELAFHQAEHTACAAVVVDAKPDAIAYYRDKFGFKDLSIEGRETRAMYLLLQDVRAAVDAARR